MSNEFLKGAKSLFLETVALLTEDREQEIYERLSELSISLDEDPLLFGPKRLQERIFEVRRALDVTETIWLAASQRLHRASQDHRGKNLAFEMSKKYLFATDPTVRQGKSAGERDALASILLRDEYTEVNLAEAIRQELDAVVSVIKAKRADLKNTQSVLREQHKLCHARIERGEFWGSAVPGAQPVRAGKMFDDDVNVLSLIASVDSEMENRAAFAEEGELAPEPEVEPEVEVEVEPEQVDPEPKVEPAPPKVTPLPKNAFAELKIPDAEIDDIGDWLDELGALEVVTEIPVSEVVTEIPVSEVVTEIPVSELVTETDLSGVDFPESSKGSFTFDGEVAADFEAVLDRVEAPALHKPPTKRGVLLVADDDDVDALMDLFGDP